MAQVTTLGVDIAKNGVCVHGIDTQEHVIVQKRLSRQKLLPFVAQLPSCLIGMEASGGAHYWAREFTKLGHTVKLMSPQFVKPYVQSQKNDPNDAAGICEAVARPRMRGVPVKSVAQQDVGSVSKVEMTTPIALICKVLFPSISTFETPPTTREEMKNRFASWAEITGTARAA